MKKVLKAIKWIFLVLLILFVIVTTVCTIWRKSVEKKSRKILEEDGYSNLFSAGDYDMNINIIGSGKNKIIAMPGNGDSGFPIYMEEFYKHLEDDDISLIVVSRPGYGLSGNTKDYTTEHIVESTRTALNNAGIEAPFILMPHSLSGIYATYWESKHPEEVSGVVFLDSTCEADEGMPEKGPLKLLISGYFRLNSFKEKTGLSMALSKLSGEDECEDMYAAYEKDLSAFYNVSATDPHEMLNINANMETAWSSIKSNDIPKVYVTTNYESKEDVDEYLTYVFGNVDEGMEQNLVSEIDSEWSKERLQKKSEYCEKLGNCEMVNIPGSHFIFEQKPDETAAVINDLIKRIK